jgi:poly(beta-D-mannuronate) lyase
MFTKFQQSFRVSRLLLAGITGAASAGAANHAVDSAASLKSAIERAEAGDVISVKSGSYTVSDPIIIKRSGSPGKPIVIKAEAVGSVTIGGNDGFKFEAPVAHITLEGFRFTHANAINIPGGTHHIRLTRNFIALSVAPGTDVSFINIAGDDVEIDRNEFANKSTLGEMLDVTGTGTQVARRLRVHHNYFHDFKNAGGNGAETIRLGLSGLSMSTGDAIVEYNLFERCNGENELISNKSCGNIYRFNTFVDSPGAQLTLRHGNDCQAYGNYFRNTDGLRVFGDRHLIHSNYFEGNTKGIDMGNGGGEVADGAKLTSHDRPDDCIIAFNTFINNAHHYHMGGRTNGLGALRVTIAHNLFVGPGNAATINAASPHTATWTGNVLWAVSNPGAIPESGFTSRDPRVSADASGIFRLSPDSPMIDAAEKSLPGVNVDMDGQPRSGSRDIGADEYSTSPLAARFLTPADVGPASQP